MSSHPTLSPLFHNIPQQRFEVQMDGHVAFAHYVRERDLIIFDHTLVPEAFRGKGVAAALVRGALEEARKRQWKIVPRCSFVAEFIERNPEFADLVFTPAL